ncbi:hypothetical protein EW146_g1741 [Bondarzewia mesenterica]|uniref:Uncharacterized protein n=1 Tax=Bondarzewia mesenterica TaxID=1095465 RepID=A0A4S4M4P2_9AGAM|nr:hypothetical protein EW146_g1741 [Bondarzewia mesenterica]
MPERGDGPRCKVFYEDIEGPWTRILIMSVDDNQVPPETEEHPCLMPRCYAIPLILMNKMIAFWESLRHPNGFIIKRSPEERIPQLTWSHMRGYTYLWRLRSDFLNAVYDANHEDVLPDNWRWPKIHGFLYREYQSFGHEAEQRALYARAEVEEGRIPYTTPDICDMNWNAFLERDRQQRKWRSFMWRHISQGYDPNKEENLNRFDAWRRGDLSSQDDADVEFGIVEEGIESQLSASVPVGVRTGGSAVREREVIPLAGPSNVAAVDVENDLSLDERIHQAGNVTNSANETEDYEADLRERISQPGGSRQSEGRRRLNLTVMHVGLKRRKLDIHFDVPSDVDVDLIY